MDSSREAKHDQEEERREDEAAASLVDVNLMVVLLSQLCTKDDEDDKNLEKERRDHVAHEIRESRARANKRFMKEPKLMEKRTHVLQPMAKEFRSRRM
ncbi:hypothetical protein BRARA_E00141 [Brassica rapa]|uniref:Uncharacterized protein n=4 Tax=Brassica TaxID=3705 RepID=M4CK10_BRACM|nr:uncharacterized protein LOC103866476 [Brassica rapa]KAG5395563.1 hypothetical protein IGI04_017377 [Brassica rapa subsp. trilocularis]RID60960.1 hypothetical protein BRARA_E00141 [Brassica rapa]